MGIYIRSVSRQSSAAKQAEQSVSPKDYRVKLVRTANEGDLDGLKDRFAKVCELIVRGVSDN